LGTRKVTTIEGLSPDRSGMIMAAAALIEASPQPTDEQIDETMTNICRCGTYSRIRAAIHRTARA